MYSNSLIINAEVKQNENNSIECKKRENTKNKNKKTTKQK